MKIIPKPINFQWDKGNQNKNFLKHGVNQQEAESCFSDINKKIIKDPIHSKTEQRHILLSKSSNHRILFVVFTIRQNQVRIISIRPCNQKERSFYEKTV
jgi:uncharacterized protein